MDGSATSGSASGRGYDAIVIGAGFAGLYMLHHLRQLGLSARVFEKGAGVGGTWYWNRYPGARCDSPSVYYSYSFDRDLEQEWCWSERYPTQPEIQRYLNHVADRFDLRSDIQLETSVESARYDEGRNRWSVRTSDGEAWEASFLIAAVGSLNQVNAPDLPGLERFAGARYHTARWPEEGVDLSGKRVGVVGTGSSAIQAIPQIARQAAHLTVFQRTANFSLPANNYLLTEAYQREIKTNYPALRQEGRMSGYGVPLPQIPEPSALLATPEERQKKYEAGWAEGGVFMLMSYADIITDVEANETAAEFVRQKIRQTVKDPVVAERLAPKTHPIGTKRPCVDIDYFETYNRDNVTLVDLRETPITEVTETSVRTSAGEHPLDALVFATGFDAMAGAFLAIDIHGRGGVSLREKWTDGPTTYLGLQVVGFPNLFTIAGPGSPSVLSNVPTSIEQHVEWIGDCLAHMKAHGLDRIEPTPEAEAAWGERVQEAAHATLYPTAESWYMGANIAGKTRLFTPYAGGVGEYRRRCTAVAEAGYPGFVISAAAAAEVGETA